MCGGPGCGKTVLAMEFLVRGARDLGEPGVFLSFEEDAGELVQNFESFGYGLQDLVDQKLLHVSQAELGPTEIVETGAFSLDGLFVRLEHAIDRIGARRVAIDTLELLFSRFPNSAAMRGEIARLFRWLKNKGVTTVITGERGDSELTRAGLTEYVSDCVLVLDHRIVNQISKRRLRVVKYRGSRHGLDEYPFLIGDGGVSVIPITSATLEYDASEERVTTGVRELDEMFGGRGYFRGSSVLVSGTAGTGKTTLAASFAAASAERGERCLYLALEESAHQIARNAGSVNIDLAGWIDKDLLSIMAFRPTQQGLEEHIVSILTRIETFEPKAVVLDPISNFVTIGSNFEVKSMLTRLIDSFKERGITTLLTSLEPTRRPTETTISSLVDTWMVLTHQIEGTLRRRQLYVIKSRGMSHSNEQREFSLSDQGISLHPGRE